MLRALFLASTILMLPVGYASADTGPELGANAALKYWQAIATMPKFTDEEQTKLMEEYLKMPLDSHARELVTKSEYALGMVLYAAAIPNCNWGISWKEDGPYVRLPQLMAARVLTSLACLRARIEFEEGHTQEAIDDLVVCNADARPASLAGRAA